MLSRRPFLQLALGAGYFIATSVAAARPSFPIVAEASLCRVRLIQVSYDDPDGDDAELLELQVERLAAPAPGDAAPGADASGSSTTGVDASELDGGAGPSEGGQDSGARGDSGASSSSLRLGDCGLGSLELVNGGSGACEKYRTLSVTDVSVPEGGFLVFCAVDSVHAASGQCDVTATGRTTLRNGWLQNGPNDGIRFVDPAGQIQAELGYESGPACFSSVAVLPEETGKAFSSSGTVVDDVSVLCGSTYRILPSSSAPLHEPIVCPDPDAGLAGPVDAQVSGSGGAGEPWQPEYAPDFSTGGAPGMAEPLAPTPLPERATMPSPPACSATRGARGCPGASAIALCLLLGLGARRRTTRHEPGRPG